MPASDNHCCLASALLRFKFCAAVLLCQGLTLPQKKQIQGSQYRNLKTINELEFSKRGWRIEDRVNRALVGLPPWHSALKHSAVHSKTNFAFVVLTIFTKWEHFESSVGMFLVHWSSINRSKCLGFEHIDLIVRCTLVSWVHPIIHSPNPQGLSLENVETATVNLNQMELNISLSWLLVSLLCFGWWHYGIVLPQVLFIRLRFLWNFKFSSCSFISALPQTLSWVVLRSNGIFVCHFFLAESGDTPPPHNGKNPLICNLCFVYMKLIVAVNLVVNLWSWTH